MRKNQESSTTGMPHFVLLAAVLVALVVAIGVYLFYSPGKGTSIASPHTSSITTPASFINS